MLSGWMRLCPVEAYLCVGALASLGAVLRPRRGLTEQRGWVVQGDHLRSAHACAGCERFAG
jgi:hypothetical protein